MTSPYRPHFDRFWALLKESHPIAFSVHLARITGHPKAAVLLSQLTYWTRHGRDVVQNDGWIFKTREEWLRETGLSRDEQETARKHLRDLDLIQEWRGGKPARLWYRINRENLVRMLGELHQSALPLNLSFDFMRVEEAAMRKALGPTIGYHRILAELTGGVNAGLVLSRLIALQRRALDSGAGMWISVTAKDWQRDIALNRRQLENAKHKLCQLKLIDEQLTQTFRKRLYTQVNTQRLLELLQPIVARASGGAAMTRDLAADDLRSRLFAAADQFASNAVAPNVRFPPTTKVETGFPFRTSVRKHPSNFSQPEKLDGGKRTLVDGGKRTQKMVENVHGVRRETYIANARADLITSLTTSTTTRTHVEPPPVGTVRGTVGVVSSIALIWPPFVRRAEQQVIADYLTPKNAPSIVQQEFLDEMAVNHRSGHPVQNPVGYVRTLYAQFQAGTWLPERAHLERERRERAAQASTPAAQPGPPDRSNPALARTTMAGVRDILKQNAFKQPGRT